MTALERLKAWGIAGWKAPLVSPAGFLVRAAVLAGVYGLLTALGLRPYMSALTLTFPEGRSPAVSFFACGIYLLSYFGFILGTPILAIAAGLLAIGSRLAPGLTGASRPGGPRPP